MFITIFRKMNKLFRILIFALIVSVWGCNGHDSKNKSSVYDAFQFGAKPDSVTLNTQYLQNAIDYIYSKGGGTLVLQKGNYVTGTLELKSNITLRLEAGANLLGSANIDDYTEKGSNHSTDNQPYHLIYASNCQNISIEGKGCIDGRGENFWKNPNADPNKPNWILAKDKKISPLIVFDNVKNLIIKDVTIKTGGGWNLHLLNSELIKIDGIIILNNLFSPNSDGIDVSGCNDVMISNCFIRTCDDGICIKTPHFSKPAERITVTNCIIETSCVALKLGYGESYFDMRDITFSNCVISKSHRAIGLYTCQGAIIQNIAISNIVANTNAPITLPIPIHLLAQQRTDSSKAGGIRNVTISGVEISTQGRIMMTASENTFIENVTLRDIRLNYPYIEDPKPYFKPKMSSQFPKWSDGENALKAEAAIIALNVDNLVLDNIHTIWPDTSAQVPSDWQHTTKVQNGISETFSVSYPKTHLTDLSLLYAEKCNGGYVRAPLATSSAKMVNKLNIVNSNLKIID